MYVQHTGLRPSSTNHWRYSTHGIRPPRKGLAPKHRRTSLRPSRRTGSQRWSRWRLIEARSVAPTCKRGDYIDYIATAWIGWITVTVVRGFRLPWVKTQ
ncbi:uncharacterized protein AFUA_4G01430 [Aspergillus fumigatus Af293]|uniref:Uncharacterized protein n=2 Tax=Aspergillus fumigatus TaxID=746128 RepID=Q4W9G4_ASPFU|nr:hypothetical protein AFUA_4G01430 [Aspergillus fumigatus Af293]EAL84276.1 hypothetical protein AFUA_4G01430 [Aspergillus fumigatus Af293]EDP47198.1 hypothetical protein AFUB_101910 [Aspergillus fumigatus A1163]